MDERVLALVNASRLSEAAELARDLGDHKLASTLFEQGCSFGEAADEAFRAKLFARALELAILAGNNTVANRALDEVLAQSQDEALKVASRLVQRNFFTWAARVYEALGQDEEAARLWEDGDAPILAAHAFERAGFPPLAAKALERARAKDPINPAITLALGELLFRHGKYEAAAKTLQTLPITCVEHTAGAHTLSRALRELGLASASQQPPSERPEVTGTYAAGGGPPSERAGARLYSRYRILSEVASTANARVLQCEDLVQNESVAIKIFAGFNFSGSGRDALLRFEREQRTLQAIAHPNVVGIREYVAEGPAIVMPWMPGGDLEHLLQKEPITPGRAAEIAESILLALAHAHQLGVLHRDIKPANILFDGSGSPRLSDFGTAHLTDRSATATAAVIGTQGYMSPEQLRGEPATVASDVYQVGVVLLEMLTGRVPSVDGVSILPSAVHRELTAKHDEVVLAMVRGNPEERPESALVARSRIASLHWPKNLDHVFTKKPMRAASNTEDTHARLVQATDGTGLDTWLDRSVATLAMDAEVLARASVFAAVGHDIQQVIYRVDLVQSQLWLDAGLGAKPLARLLSDTERLTLQNVLLELHRAGYVHGHVDRDHVCEQEGGIWLRFAARSNGAMSEDDLRALETLTGT